MSHKTNTRPVEYADRYPFKYGMSMEEVAIILDIPIETAWTLLYRALKKLSKSNRLKEYLYT